MRGGRGGREGRKHLCPCTKCSCIHVVYTLSLFLISPFCCYSLSRYKKVPQERYSIILILTVRCSYAMCEVELAGKTQSTKYIVQSVPTDPAVNVHIHTFINFQQKFLTALGKSKQFLHCSPMLGLPKAALKGMFSFVRM